MYKRWCAFGLLSSHSRLHGSTSYRVPWLYDEEAVDVLRFFTNLKMRLMPYLYRAAVQAHTEGIPTMRAMALEFPKDRTCLYLDRQYMLGDNLLVAPVMNDRGIGEYYLPKGCWTNFFTNERRDGLIMLSCKGEGTYTVELIGVTGLSVQGAAMEVQKDRTALAGCQSEMAVRIEEGQS